MRDPPPGCPGLTVVDPALSLVARTARPGVTRHAAPGTEPAGAGGPGALEMGDGAAVPQGRAAASFPVPSRAWPVGSGSVLAASHTLRQTAQPSSPGPSTPRFSGAFRLSLPLLATPRPSPTPGGAKCQRHPLPHRTPTRWLGCRRGRRRALAGGTRTRLEPRSISRG